MPPEFPPKSVPECLLRQTNVTEMRANVPPPPRKIITQNIVRAKKVQKRPAVRRMLGPRVVVMWLTRGTGRAHKETLDIKKSFFEKIHPFSFYDHC